MPERAFRACGSADERLCGGRGWDQGALENCRRDLALFNLAIDTKLRGCDLVRLRVDDLCMGGHVRDRATVVQQKRSRPVNSAPGSMCSRAGFATSRISRRDSTRGSSIAGSNALGSIVPPTGPTRCGEPRQHGFTRRQATCEPFNCCSGTRSSKARFVISASRSTMRSVSRNRSNSDLIG